MIMIKYVFKSVNAHNTIKAHETNNVLKLLCLILITQKILCKIV